MGTTAPIYFGFRNRQAKGMTDDKVLLHFLGSKMSMAAIRMGTPMSIVLDRLSGSMVWSWPDETGSRAYRSLQILISNLSWSLCRGPAANVLSACRGFAPR